MLKWDMEADWPGLYWKSLSKEAPGTTAPKDPGEKVERLNQGSGGRSDAAETKKRLVSIEAEEKRIAKIDRATLAAIASLPEAD